MSVQGFGDFEFPGHAPELGGRALECEPEDVGYVFSLEVAGARDPNRGTGLAFFDEGRYVSAFEVVRYPVLFLQVAGQGGMAAACIASM